MNRLPLAIFCAWLWTCSYATAGALAFSRSSGGAFDIYLLDRITGVPQALTATADADEWSPSWSASGELLAWFEDGRQGIAIVVADSEGSIRQKIRDIPPPTPISVGAYNRSRLSWNPDDGRFAYITSDDQLAIVEPSGEFKIIDAALSPVGFWLGDVEWLSNSDTLLWLFSRLYVFDLGGTIIEERAPQVDGGEVWPNAVVHRSTGRVAFISIPFGKACEGPCPRDIKDDSPQIHFLEDRATASARRLTTTPTEKCCLSWSSDGSHLVFSEKRGADDWDLTIVSTVDGTQETITSGPSHDTQPTWQPKEVTTLTEAASWGRLKHRVIRASPAFQNGTDDKP